MKFMEIKNNNIKGEQRETMVSLCDKEKTFEGQCKDEIKKVENY